MIVPVRGLSTCHLTHTRRYRSPPTHPPPHHQTTPRCWRRPHLVDQLPQGAGRHPYPRGPVVAADAEGPLRRR
ncbi:hypothetical protein chiPu_0026600 [Chiloscyllium punctatum]|uniref:Uncharacterized protein n=1 Tax=Chiloscyllium punctatum TaxID=137246 RepID=A0A401TJP0_CHIPU|nr:hypothetical protein [Chiloscyllium punctatum]